MVLVSKKKALKGLGRETLLSEKDFLKVQARARRLNVFLKSVRLEKDTVIWKTTSGTIPGKYWTQMVDISNFNDKFELSARRPSDLVKAIREAGLKVYCDCPAFLYWGYQYMAWKGGYGIKPERRRPIVRNPELRGYLCKHLYALMETYPFWAPTVAKQYRNEIKKRFGGDTDFRNQ